MPFLSPSAFDNAMPSVMPMSSTVWWASISRSPLARTERSIAPWRASWSSMWSRNGMPDASDASPLPSRSTATKTCVSRVSRWICALRILWGSGFDNRGERLEQFRVLVGGADREPQAVGEQGMRAVECPDQYTTLLEALERRRAVGNACQDEIGRRGESPHAGQGVEAACEALAFGHD